MNLPDVPTNLDPVLYRLLKAMRDQLLSLAGSGQPPAAPSNLRVTPCALGCIFDFTLSNADRYVVYYGDTPNFAVAMAQDLGQANRFSDTVGKSGVTRYYWVRGFNNSGQSDLVGPVSGVTLAAATEIVPPPPPPPRDPIYEGKDDWFSNKYSTN